MTFLALSAPPSTATIPTLAEAFFRTHWAALSARAGSGGWYGDDHFFGSLLDEAKLPLLAAAVREVYYVYGPLCAWELQCHPYLDAEGRAFVAWSYAGKGEMEGGVWEGVRKRAEEVGLGMEKVVLEGVGGAEFARVVRKEDGEGDGDSEE